MGWVIFAEPPTEEAQQRVLRFLRFEVGFVDLIKAYRSAMRAQQEVMEDPGAFVRRTISEHHDEPAASDDATREPRLGRPLSREELIIHAEFEAEASMGVLRIAFLIALFHFWERHILNWTQMARYDHAEAMGWLKANGGAPDEALLRRLELACHCAKHGPGASADRLFALAPDHFDLDVRDDEDRTLRVGDAALDAYFAAVFRAAPRTSDIDR